MIEVQSTDGATLASVIKDVLLRCQLELGCCRGQAYDGASNMSGCFKGVASRLINEEPTSLYVHCSAHCLNLCLQDCSNKCACIRDALSLTNEISNLIRNFPKKLANFKSIKHSVSADTPSLKPLCPTRWTIRTAAINAILVNYPAISEELTEIGNSRCEASSRAVGIMALMDRFSTFFGLKLAYLVFSATEEVSTTLQYKDINVQEALTAVKSAQHFLERQRSDSAFDLFYDSVVKEATEKDLQQPTLPRQKRIPKRIDDNTQNHVYSTPKDFFRHQYYEVLDLLNEELVSRFDQPTYMILKEMESLLIDSCNCKHTAISSNFKNLYAKEFNFDVLTAQLSMLPSVITAANMDCNLGIKKVTSVNTLCDVFNTSNFPKTMLVEVNKLIHIYYTIPLTSATAERSFSTLRWLKSYLRSTMSQRRLNHLVLLHIHKNITDQIDLQSIAADFVNRNTRRINYFGQFK